MAEGITSRLYDLAEGQDGYFSTSQAIEIGISRRALAHATARSGTLQRISRGVYRLSRYPEVSTNAHYWAALLWPQSRGSVRTVLSHYTALALHELSDTNSARVHITVPRSLRVRREIPGDLVVHRADLGGHEVQYVDGLSTTTVDRTLRDIADLGDAVVLHDALRDARSRGLVIPPELRDV